MAKDKNQPYDKMICQNRKATHLYHIEERMEAGLELRGTEVKSLRQGGGSIGEAFAKIKRGEIFLHQFHIPPYEQGNRFNVDPVRTRKLLLHRREIARLEADVTRKGYTIVPLKVYFLHGLAKVEIGLARGKKQADKREDLKTRDQKREMDRALRRFNR